MLGALVAALAALYIPRARIPTAGLGAAARALRAWHSGHIGDYVTWLVVGVVVLGWALVATLP